MAAADPVEVLEIVKLRFKLSTDNHDDIVNSYIREIGRRIRHYCNISTVPEALTDVWASMVMDALLVEQTGIPEIAENLPVELSVKIGDTSVAPAKSTGLTSTTKTSIDSIVLSYAADLNRYRKLGF
ncbi:phage head-tail connector protein [Paenibacillus sinopodophylli]|uniref:phage head-tail connector protein n=1 Tax=Paenibacillus sinopodophylli TaxID=1837342 RepID=UPI00110CAB80|nr:phage head-tail connector protein [Paenibacillus sinopodophylli]